MIRNLTPGAFIAVEGLDGAGTTSQCRLLVEWLVNLGIEVELTSEPSQGPIGSLLRSALTGRFELDSTALALAFAADRHDHIFNAVDGIKEHIDSGRWVICDRYVLSSLAYQASQGEDVDWLVRLNAKALVPDLTIFIDTPTSICVERIMRRSRTPEVFHDGKSLSRVRQKYREVLASGSFIEGLVTADGSEPIELVSKQVREGVVSWAETTNFARLE